MSEWVPVCETEGAQPVEIETDDDGTMPLASIIAHFPGTTTLKFRAPVRFPPFTLCFIKHCSQKGLSWEM